MVAGFFLRGGGEEHTKIGDLMVTYVKSCVQSGAGADIISVECDMSFGIPGLTIVGLPDASVKESRERLRAAIINSGYDYPTDKRIIINLAPADTRKEGTHLDLAMALCLMTCAEGIDGSNNKNTAVIGELSLDGKVNPVRGILPLCIGLRQEGIRRVIVPVDNIKDVEIVEDMDFFPVSFFREAFLYFKGELKIEAINGKRPDPGLGAEEFTDDFSEVRGRNEAKRVIEISVSGFHHLLMSGPPGCGKSMMAKRIYTVLPGMTYEEMLEVTKLYSLYGFENNEGGLIFRRPFRAPSTTTSVAAMIGGGSGIPKPGEITLSHLGVLFLDEIPEFRRDVLEALRQPLEDEKVTMSRSGGKITFPAKFVLVGARNPCPCGYYGDVRKTCRCTPNQIRHYRDRLSGPIMDRFDLFIDLHADSPDPGEAEKKIKDISSAEMRARIEKARAIQEERYKLEEISYNSQLTGAALKKYCHLDGEAKELYRQGCEALKVSRRGGDKVLRVARTIADIEGEERIGAAHIGEALQYRRRDEEYQKI